MKTDNIVDFKLGIEYTKTMINMKIEEIKKSLPQENSRYVSGWMDALEQVQREINENLIK